MHAVLRLFQRVAWLLLFAGILFQGFIKDRWDPGAIAFYAMPKPLLGLLAFGLAIVSRRTQRWLAAAAGVAPKLLAKSPSPAAAPVSASAPFKVRTETRAIARSSDIV